MTASSILFVQYKSLHQFHLIFAASGCFKYLMSLEILRMIHKLIRIMTAGRILSEPFPADHRPFSKFALILVPFYLFLGVSMRSLHYNMVLVWC